MTSTKIWDLVCKVTLSYYRLSLLFGHPILMRKSFECPPACSPRAAPQTALEFEGKIFHMAQSPEHYHQMVEKCVKGGEGILPVLGTGSSEQNEIMHDQ